jgi:hypothetical protein
MKILFVFLMLVMQFTVTAQSKKDQIEALTQQRDSISSVLHIELSSAIKKTATYDSIISVNSKKVQQLNDSIIRLNSNLSILDNQLINVNKELTVLKRENGAKSDSLKLFMKENSPTDDVFELNYSCLNKPATTSMNDIYDWLSLFTLVSKNTTTFIDEKAARLYGGDEPLLEVHGKVTFSNSIYKEGIIINERTEYEGQQYQLFIPLLNSSDVRKHIDKLCKNMGGCVSPEDMNINYEETEFGIKVTWGGGC